MAPPPLNRNRYRPECQTPLMSDQSALARLPLSVTETLQPDNNDVARHIADLRSAHPQFAHQIRH